MRIGIMAGSGAGAPTIREQVDRIVQTEQDGFDSFWLPQAPNICDLLTLYAMAGDKTSRIEMGTAIVPTYSRHPIAMALQSLTTQAATGGRLALGIGASHQVRVESELGLSYEKPALHVREYLTVLRDLVHTGKSDFTGKVFDVNLTHNISDASPFPILVAAHGPAMLRLAGELADGAIIYLVGPRTLESHIVPRIMKASESANRPSPRICYSVPVAVTDDVSAGREAVEKVSGHFNKYPSFRKVMDMEGARGPGDVALVGNESEIEHQLRTIASAGATDLLASIVPVGEDPEVSISRTREFLKSMVGKI